MSAVLFAIGAKAAWRCEDRGFRDTISMSRSTDDFIDQARSHALYEARQRRLRETMIAHEIPVMLIVDPVKIRYASGSRNMQVFASRDASRYLLLFAEGPAILFEYPGCLHLAEDLPTLDEVREAQGIAYVGPEIDTSAPARAWAQAMGDLIRGHAGAGSILAIDRLHFAVVEALREQSFHLVDAEIVIGAAQAIKQAVEIPFIRRSMRVVERAVEEMHTRIRPGMTENEAWAHFHRGLIERDAEYVTTRLMVAGQRSFPYFRESGPYAIANGDLIAFDTDAIGVDGYAIDFSRTFFCGSAKPSARQRKLYALAYEQLQSNILLFRPGTSFRTIAENAWRVPEKYRERSYYVIAHGIGLSGEYPAIPQPFFVGGAIPDGVIEPGMTVCVESYIGSDVDAQGVKLEEHLLITDGGFEVLSRYPFEEALHTREF